MLYLSRSRGLNQSAPAIFESASEREPESLVPVPEQLERKSALSPKQFPPPVTNFGAHDEWSGDLLTVRGYHESETDTDSEQEDDEDKSEEEEDEKEREQEDDGGFWLVLSPEEAMASRQLVEAQRHYKQLLQESVDRKREQMHYEIYAASTPTPSQADPRVREEELELANLLTNLQFRTKTENSILLQQHSESVAKGVRTQTCTARAEQAALRAKSHAEAAAKASTAALAAVERMAQARRAAEEKLEEKRQQPVITPISVVPPAQEEKKESAAPPGAVSVSPEGPSEALQAATKRQQALKALAVDDKGLDQRKIMVAVNQISGTQDQVMKKVTQLKGILASAPSPQALNFGLVSLAQAICKQELTQEKAFSYAIVMLFVTLDYPVLNDVFLATLDNECSFCIPNYLNRANYKSLNDYKAALGFREVRPEPREFEDEEKYVERMQGFVRLYAAYTQIQHPNHPHGIGEAWKWCAQVLNTKPVFATAAVLWGFLEVAGYQMQLSFPRQFRKMMQFINDDFAARLAEKNPAQFAAKRRLQLFVEHKYFKNNCQLSVPTGRDLPRTQASDFSRPQIEQGDENRF